MNKQRKTFLKIVDNKEKEKLIDRIISKIREISTLSKEVHRYSSNWHVRIISADVLGEHIQNDISCDEKGKIYHYDSDEDDTIYYNFFVYHIFNRIKYKIRMDASIEHIKFLEDIIGIERTLILLKNFAERNRFVALILENYIQSKQITANGGKTKCQ